MGSTVYSSNMFSYDSNTSSLKTCSIVFDDYKLTMFECGIRLNLGGFGGKSHPAMPRTNLAPCDRGKLPRAGSWSPLFGCHTTTTP